MSFIDARTLKAIGTKLVPLQCYNCGDTAQTSLLEPDYMEHLYECTWCKNRGNRSYALAKLQSNYARLRLARGNVVNMKIQNMTSAWLRPTDIKTGTTVEFTSEAVEEDGKWGKRLVVDAVLSDGAKGKLTVNKTSQRALIEAWGDETGKWIGRRARASVVLQTIGNRRKDVLVLEPIK